MNWNQLPVDLPAQSDSISAWAGVSARHDDEVIWAIVLVRARRAKRVQSQCADRFDGRVGSSTRASRATS
jgi:hypothetical protein